MIELKKIIKDKESPEDTQENKDGLKQQNYLDVVIDCMTERQRPRKDLK